MNGLSIPVLCLASIILQAADPLAGKSRSGGIHEYFVVGTVVNVRPDLSTISIRGTNLLGYLRFRIKTYRVRRPGVLASFQPGDRVQAVYSIKDGKLYALRHVDSRPGISRHK